MKRLAFFISLILLNINAISQTVIVEEEFEKGTILNDIDLQTDEEIIAILKSKNEPNKLKLKLADSVLQLQNNFHPPVLFAASRVLYSNNQPYKAAHAFYLAQIRTSVDYALCKDSSLTKTLTALSEVYGVSIKNFCTNNVDSFKAIIIDCLEKIDANIGNYDHRWLMLHSSKVHNIKDKSKLSNNDLIAKKEEWNTIKTAALNNYYQNFINYLESLK